jgi:hypothetical protein
MMINQTDNLCSLYTIVDLCSLYTIVDRGRLEILLLNCFSLSDTLYSLSWSDYWSGIVWKIAYFRIFDSMF